MNVIKPHRRCIAWVAAFAFFWLIQADCLPLRAESTGSQQPAFAASGQGPDYHEAVSQKAAPGKKKSILPWILIGVGLAGASLALYFLVLKTDYNIVGTWNVMLVWSDGGSDNPVITFAGTKKSGTLTSDYDDTGTYSVKGKEVTWTFAWDTTFVWTGKFSGKDSMSGTLVWGSASETGTWTATRTAAATAMPQPKSWKKDTR
jgi:hypothetical protein